MQNPKHIIVSIQKHLTTLQSTQWNGMSPEENHNLELVVLYAK